MKAIPLQLTPSLRCHSLRSWNWQANQQNSRTAQAGKTFPPPPPPPNNLSSKEARYVLLRTIAVIARILILQCWVRRCARRTSRTSFSGNGFAFWLRGLQREHGGDHFPLSKPQAR
eukprot:299710-Amphidinium_carterae.1